MPSALNLNQPDLFLSFGRYPTFYDVTAFVVNSHNSIQLDPLIVPFVPVFVVNSEQILRFGIFPKNKTTKPIFSVILAVSRR